jgi:hypothetical protein
MTRQRSATWFADLRESAWERSQREAAEAAHLARRRAVTHKRLKSGRSVERPPTLKGVGDGLDAWNDELNETLDAFEQAVRREAALSRTESVDTDRFPVMRGRGL